MAIVPLPAVGGPLVLPLGVGWLPTDGVAAPPVLLAAVGCGCCVAMADLLAAGKPDSANLAPPGAGILSAAAAKLDRDSLTGAEEPPGLVDSGVVPVLMLVAGEAEPNGRDTGP